MLVVERLLALGLIGAIVLDFVNVAGRYTGGFTLLGADEIEIYVLIWIAFLGAVAVTWRRLHLRMDVFYHACPPAVGKVVAIFELAVTLVVTGFVAIQSFNYVDKLYVLGVKSDIVRVPMWIPHMAVVLCFGAVAAITALRGFRLITGPGEHPEQGAS